MVIAAAAMAGYINFLRSSAWKGILGFDISPDGQSIALTSIRYEQSFLYTMNRDATDIREFENTKNLNPAYPVFSPDGGKVAFVAFTEGLLEPESKLYLVNSDGGNLQHLSTPQKHITSAVFSKDGKTIYYLASGYFGHYSPIAASAPHDFDIFAFNLESKEIHQITQLKAYEMKNLSLAPDGKQLLFQEYGSTDHGFGIVPLDNPTQIQHVTLKNPEEAKLSASSSDWWTLGHPTMTPQGQLLVTAVADENQSPYKYELYQLDPPSWKDKRLTFLDGFVSQPRVVPGENKILFLKDERWPDDPPHNRLWEVSLDGTNPALIEIPGLDS